MRDFRDRVAVVTGAASGIGRATAEALARRGADLALVDLDEAGLAATADRVRAAGRAASLHVVDVADRAGMEALPGKVVGQHGRVHVLVNNAGVSVAAELAEHAIEDFQWVVGVNLWGVVHGCRFFLPWLLQEEEAHIVNVSSMFGFVGFPGQSAYCATKFAVRGLTEALYAELSGTGVGVTSVHPGAIQTRIIHSTRGMDDAQRARTLALFERHGTPPERVAKRIVRAMERRKLRVIVTPEAFVTEWLKRLLPVTTHRLIAWSHRRAQNGSPGGPATRPGGRTGGTVS